MDMKLVSYLSTSTREKVECENIGYVSFRPTINGGIIEFSPLWEPNIKKRNFRLEINDRYMGEIALSIIKYLADKNIKKKD